MSVKKRKIGFAPSKEQKTARERNAKILHLRGLYANAKRLISSLMDQERILEIVDKELKSMGAEGEGYRRQVAREAVKAGGHTVIEGGKIYTFKNGEKS